MPDMVPQDPEALGLHRLLPFNESLSEWYPLEFRTVNARSAEAFAAWWHEEDHGPGPGKTSGAGPPTSRGLKSA